MVTTPGSSSQAAPPPPHPLFNSSVGGALCLDFVNSMGGRDHRGPGGDGHDYRDVVRAERLTTYQVLVDWATWLRVLRRDDAQRLLGIAEAQPRAATAAWVRAIRLREAIYRLCRAAIEGWPCPAADLDVLNEELRLARPHQRLEPGAKPPAAARRRSAPDRVQPYRWTWDTDDDRLDAMLGPIATSAADLLASDDLRRVGQCPASGCGWLFLDTSRSGRRQWCDMAVCGNAEKVRRFRERQRRARTRASRR